LHNSSEFPSTNPDISKIDILWRTSSACKTEEIKDGKNCRLDNGKGFVIDLNHLAGTYSIGENIKFSICSETGLDESCGSNEESAGISLCRNMAEIDNDNSDWEGISGSSGPVLQYKDEIVTLEYQKFSESSDSGAEVHVLFFCDETATDSKPFRVQSGLDRGYKKGMATFCLRHILKFTKMS
jgi:hypothetical protein